MNILFFYRVYPNYGGVEIVTSILAKRFVADGHHVTIASLEQPHPELNDQNIEGVELVCLHYPVLLYEKFIPKVEDGGIHIWAAQHATDEVKQRMFEDSIAEMWMLAMTKTLFWQGNSSFSYISKLFRDKENKKL